MDDLEQYRIMHLQRLYNEVTQGTSLIRSQEDASITAAILRLLIEELDPENKGDPEKAKQYINKVKYLIQFNE